MRRFLWWLLGPDPVQVLLNAKLCADLRALEDVLRIRSKEAQLGWTELGKCVQQLNRTTRGVQNIQTRLSHYEHEMPTMAKAKKALEAKAVRQERARLAESVLAGPANGEEPVA